MKRILCWVSHSSNCWFEVMSPSSRPQEIYKRRSLSFMDSFRPGTFFVTASGLKVYRGIGGPDTSFRTGACTGIIAPGHAMIAPLKDATQANRSGLFSPINAACPPPKTLGLHREQDRQQHSWLYDAGGFPYRSRTALQFGSWAFEHVVSVESSSTILLKYQR